MRNRKAQITNLVFSFAVGGLASIPFMNFSYVALLIWAIVSGFMYKMLSKPKQ